jgi:hypothetical protein
MPVPRHQNKIAPRLYGKTSPKSKFEFVFSSDVRDWYHAKTNAEQKERVKLNKRNLNPKKGKAKSL